MKGVRIALAEAWWLMLRRIAEASCRAERRAFHHVTRLMGFSITPVEESDE